MNVVDSSGWIEFFVEGANASLFSEPLAEVDALLVPTVSILEVSKFVLRHRDEADMLQAAASMRRGELVDLDGELALLAAKLSVDLGLPLATASSTRRHSGQVLRSGRRIRTSKGWTTSSSSRPQADSSTKRLD